MSSGSRAVSMVQEVFRVNWRKEKVHGGGMVLDWGVHLLDQILYMYGDRKIETVYASLTMSPTRKWTMDSLTILTF